ncbi:ABC transporter permease [Pelagibaculum spongiae]|uniref:Spermidine/putrescine ABC transporter permease n=1 Tax=Pelagibaculum spongiae TaxID=2080658 RepID=A0A2V1GWY0_9GAMM|nr:ABC transporter permease [Pelagibaculum spongiae]PVZ70163.1 spermidine/putrescine ABC transporter permease [Pelagibaculum spongiae]
MISKSSISKKLYTGLWSIPLPLWFTLFFVGPILLLFWLSFWDVKNFVMVPGFNLDNWEKILGANYFWSAYTRTILFALGTAILTTAIAFPASLTIAYLMPLKARLVVLGLIIVPFFTSYLVRIYSWQVYLSENGIIQNAFSYIGINIASMLNSPLALYIGFVTLTLPLAIIIQSISVLSLDKSLIDAAYNLGCGPKRIISAVIIPAAKPGIIIGALFVFIFSFGDFVTPTYLGGGKYTTLSILIADTVKSGQQWPRAAVISVIMIITLLITAMCSIAYAYRKR